MAAGDLHVGDQCVLAVVVLDHVGVARAQAALGAGGEPRAQRRRGAAGAGEAGDHVFLARGQVGDLGLVEHGDARCIDRLAQGRGERAGGGDVAERGQTVFGGVDQGAAEPALMRDMDVLDRGARQRVPDAEALQREPGAVGEREVARVLRHRLAGARVGEHDVEAGVLERERQREADRAGADDQQVMDAVGICSGHVRSWKLRDACAGGDVHAAAAVRGTADRRPARGFRWCVLASRASAPRCPRPPWARPR